MNRDDDAHSGEERREVLRFGPSRPRSRWPRWLPIGAAGLIAVAVVVAIDHGGDPSASPTPTPTAVRFPSDGEPTTTPESSPPVTVTEVGQRLLGVTAGWELFGRGSGEVVRIQLARGRVTRTAVPGLRSSGPVSFVVGPDRVVVRPLDFVPGYVVPDGRPARELRGALSRGGPAVPGPDPGQVWVETGDGDHAEMALVGLDGSKTDVSIPIPGGGSGWMTSDGRGYLLFTGIGGAYDARPDGLRRVTTGTVTAVGPTHWLAVECDEEYHCVNVVIERPSGARHILPGPAADTSTPPGVISPDGSVAVLRVDSAGKPALRLLDLASGAVHPLDVSVAPAPFPSDALAWSPDGRWLFVATLDGKLLAVDADTRRVRDLGVALPPISQVAVRSAQH